MFQRQQGRLISIKSAMEYMYLFLDFIPRAADAAGVVSHADYLKGSARGALEKAMEKGFPNTSKTVDAIPGHVLRHGVQKISKSCQEDICQRKGGNQKVFMTNR